jgi:excisionase family DNA binding protein
MTIEPEELYRVPEVAEYLHVKPQQATIWLARKEIKGAKFGRQWLVRGKDLIAFVDARIEGKPAGSSRTVFEARKRFGGTKY